jgi:threonine/homoserine/homoserine lactone efflux protein
MIIALILGVALGFVGSMPVAGPISILVLKYALENRRREAISLSIGASVAEAAYAFIAFWGLSSVVLRYPNTLPTMRIVGALVLIGIGAYFGLRRPTLVRSSDETVALTGTTWITGFAVTMFNPTLIVTWTTIITALHATSIFRLDPSDAIPFAVGVVGGIVGWFVVLIALVQRFRAHLQPKTITVLIRSLGSRLDRGGGGMESHPAGHLRRRVAPRLG